MPKAGTKSASARLVFARPAHPFWDGPLEPPHGLLRRPHASASSLVDGRVNAPEGFSYPTDVRAAVERWPTRHPRIAKGRSRRPGHMTADVDHFNASYANRGEGRLERGYRGRQLRPRWPTRMRSSSRFTLDPSAGCARFPIEEPNHAPAVPPPTHDDRSPRPATQSSLRSPAPHRKSSNLAIGALARRGAGILPFPRLRFLAPRRARSAALQWGFAPWFGQRETSVSPDSTRTVGARVGLA